MISFVDASAVAPDTQTVIVYPTTLDLRERHISVIGANGSGKSTLVKMINGLVAPTFGTVTVAGLDVVKDGAKVRRSVGYLFTDPSSQLIMPTAIEDVLLSLRRVIKGRGERERAAVDALDAVGLGDKADLSVHALSGGQRQLLAIAGVLSIKPSVLIADEPTTLLDLRWKRTVNTLLTSLDLQLIEVTHDLDAAMRAQRSLVVDGGSVVFDGDPRQAVDYYRNLMGSS